MAVGLNQIFDSINRMEVKHVLAFLVLVVVVKAADTLVKDDAPAIRISVRCGHGSVAIHNSPEEGGLEYRRGCGGSRVV